MTLRERWQRARAAYRARHPERCSRCASLRNLRGKWCSWCLAEDRERRLPGVSHHRREHARMLVRAQRQLARCSASGLTARELASIGQRLDVDRINPWRGYVIGNMQLLASSLNSLKGRSPSVPHWAPDELRDEVRRAQSPDAWEGDAMRSAGA